MKWNEAQNPDTKPGDYYVSVVNDRGDTRLLSGPYRDNHAAAVADVDKAKHIAQDIDPKAVWYAYGTVRVDHDVAGPGVLNKHGFMEVRA